MAGKKDYQVRAQVFEILYQCYQEPIKRYFVARISDKERASEFCQDTFVRLWNFLLSQETISPQIAYYKNWLYKTASNLAIDYYRHNKVIDFLPLPEGEAELSVEGDEDRIVERLWLQEEIAQMPPESRDYLLAKHYYGYTQKKIAAKFDISESAVSLNMNRGQTELRKKYYIVTLDLQMDIENARIDAWNFLYDFYPGLLNEMRTLKAKNDPKCKLCDPEWRPLIDKYIDGLANSAKLLHVVRVRQGFKGDLVDDVLAKEIPDIYKLPPQWLQKFRE